MIKYLKPFCDNIVINLGKKVNFANPDFPIPGFTT